MASIQNAQSHGLNPTPDKTGSVEGTSREKAPGSKGGRESLNDSGLRNKAAHDLTDRLVQMDRNLGYLA